MHGKFTDNAIACLKAALPIYGGMAVGLNQGDSPVVRTLVDGVCVGYVVDRGDSYQYVQQRHLIEDGIDAEQLHRVGIQNLRVLASERDLQVQSYGNVFAVLMGGDFEASLVLIDELWDQLLRELVPGEYAIAVPARDVLSFCDVRSVQGMSDLQQIISRVTPRGDHVISDKIYVRRDGQYLVRANA